MEWEAVMGLHTLRYPTGQRPVDSLRRKLAELHRETVPTGSPTSPADVSKAKEIKSRMAQRADMGEGDDFDAEYFPGYESNGDHDEITGQSPQVGQTRAAPLRVSSPRPLNRRRSTNTRSSTSEDSTIMDLFRMQMMHDREMRQEEREEARVRRDEERAERAEERARKEAAFVEERLRRDKERAEKKGRREEERRDEHSRREEEREQERLRQAEERERRDAEARRHDQMILLLLGKFNSGTSENK